MFDRLKQLTAQSTLAVLTGDGEAQARASRRAASLPSEDLVLWAESAIVGVGRAFGDWQRGGVNEAIDSLGEARMGTAALLTVLEELDSRRAAGRL